MKYLLTFLGGALIGATSVYLYLNNKIEKKVEEISSKEINDFFKRQEELMKNFKPITEETEDEDEKTMPSVVEVSSIVKPTQGEEIRTKYAAHAFDEYEEKEISDEEMAELLKESEKRMQEGPHIITKEEENLCLSYDTYEYSWYPEDDMVTNAYGQEEEEDLCVVFGPIDWRTALKDKEYITIRVPEDCADYTIYNENFGRKD